MYVHTPDLNNDRKSGQKGTCKKIVLTTFAAPTKTSPVKIHVTRSPPCMYLCTSYEILLHARIQKQMSQKGKKGLLGADVAGGCVCGRTVPKNYHILLLLILSSLHCGHWVFLSRISVVMYLTRSTCCREVGRKVWFHGGSMVGAFPFLRASFGGLGYCGCTWMYGTDGTDVLCA